MYTRESFTKYIENCIEDLKERKARRLEDWLKNDSNHRLGESAWSYFGPIVGIEEDIRHFEWLKSALERIQDLSDDNEARSKFLEIVRSHVHQIRTLLHIPSSTNQVANVMESIKLEISLKWTNEKYAQILNRWNIEVEV